MARGTLLLVDGHSLLHRAYFALPFLTDEQGRPTHAVYGFMAMMFRILEERRPTHVVVTFDRSTPTFRHKVFDGYKAHRAKMADDLRSQFPLVLQLLRGLGIAVCELDGYEADDLIGTLARQACAAGLEVLILTGDRDVLQLVEPSVTALITRKGITEIDVFDEAAVRERYGVSPSSLVEIKGLAGDASDNIPGVPGIGEKTALRLIQEYGSLQGVYENLTSIRGKLAERLAQAKSQAFMSRKLATIDRSAPVMFDAEQSRLVLLGPERVQPMLEELGFHSLIRRLSKLLAALGQDEPGEKGTVVEDEEAVTWVRDEVAVRDLEQTLETAERIGVAFELDEMNGGESLLVALACEEPAAPPHGDPGSEAGLRRGVRAFCVEISEGGPASAAVETAFSGPAEKVGHHVKPLLRAWNRRGRVAGGTWFDTALGGYLLDPSRSSYRLEDLMQRYHGRGLPALPEKKGTGRRARSSPDPTEAALLRSRLAGRAAAALEVLGPLRAELAIMGLDLLYTELELPLLHVLVAMETAGIAVDVDVLDELRRSFRARLDELAASIHVYAGESFNINSTPQLRQVLFERLGLPHVKKTKTGYSTDAEVLEELRDAHPIVPQILEHRALTKLLGTYVDGLEAQVDRSSGRVYGTFHQTIAATGRLSSADPNLQNIPVREEPGRQLRRVFVAPPGFVLVSADYSQVELRVLAHISGDERLQAAFHRGDDIHAATAAEVFGVSIAEVTRAQRSKAKAVNFGIIYGISDFGLARSLGVSRQEAKDYIDRYLERYPGVRGYMERVVRDAYRDGYVRTLFGRIRHLPELHSRNYARRQFAERAALNTPIQGTAADIIKRAMINVHRVLEEQCPGARLILQVHDELMAEAPVGVAGAAADVLQRCMEGAVALNVPLVVDLRAGPSWYGLQPLAPARS